MHKTGTKKQNALGAFLGKRHCAVALTIQILTKKRRLLSRLFFVYLMRKKYAESNLLNMP